MEEIKQTGLTLKEAKRCADIAMTDIKNGFVSTGYYLKAIRDERLWEGQGYKSFDAFLSANYEKDKSWASRCVSLYENFGMKVLQGEMPKLDPKYADYKVSQLIEMLSLSEEKREKITPQTLVREIREMKPKREKKVAAVATSNTDKETEPEEEQGRDADCVKEQYRMQKSFLYPFAVWLIKNHKNWFLADYANRVLHVDQSVPQLKAYLGASQSGFRSFGFPANDDTYYAKMYDKGIEISHFTETGDTVIDGISEWFYLAASIQSMWNEAALKEVQEKEPKTVPERPEAVLKQDSDSPGDTLDDNQKEQQEVSGNEAEKPLVLPIERGCIKGLSSYENCVCCGLGEAECCSQCKEQDSCNGVCSWLNKAPAAKTEAEEIIIDTEFKEIPQEERLTPEYFLEKEKEKLERLLRASEGVELKPGDIEVIERQKTIVAALASMVRDLETAELKKQLESEKPKQPELPVLKNNDQRAAFIDAYETWPVWIETEKTGERYYRYDLPDSTSIVVKVYHAMLFDHKKAAIKWEDRFTEGYGKNEYYLLKKGKFFKDCETNRSALIEKLKEIQKKGNGER